MCFVVALFVGFVVLFVGFCGGVDWYAYLFVMLWVWFGWFRACFACWLVCIIAAALGLFLCCVCVLFVVIMICGFVWLLSL